MHVINCYFEWSRIYEREGGAVFFYADRGGNPPTFIMRNSIIVNSIAQWFGDEERVGADLWGNYHVQSTDSWFSSDLPGSIDLFRFWWQGLQSSFISN